MLETKPFISEDYSPAQATALLRLVDLEAHWENLRNTAAPAPGPRGLEELHQVL